jgi:hypothetical protein
MAIYEILHDRLDKLSETSFSAVGVKERSDLQRLLQSQIEIISPDTLIIAEEFGDWDDSRRRIDLLGLDKDANLVVIELKRTEDGGHMDLQAIRYAAMVSTMTFDKVVEVFGEYMKERNLGGDPQQSIIDFLNWDGEEIDEEQFAQDVRIVLASADFSKEVTTTVMWLNGREIDIRCVRLKPYSDGDRIFLDVQQIIPLPEAEQYQVQIKEKIRKERIAREQSRDFTKFDVTIKGETLHRLNKRRAILEIVLHLCQSGVSPEKIRAIVPKHKNRAFEWAEEKLSSKEFIDAVRKRREDENKPFDPKRFFCRDEELIFYENKTYAFINQWGKSSKILIDLLIQNFPDQDIQCEKSD